MNIQQVKRRVSEKSSAMIEALEERRLLSASLVTAFVSPVAPRVPLRGLNEVTVRVRNVGTPARGTVSVDIYLSADATLDAGDQLLAMKPAQQIALAHNKAHPFSVRLAAPRDTPVGGYYLFAVAQAGSGFAGGNAASVITSAPRPAIVVNAIHTHGHSDDGGGDYNDDSGLDDTSTTSDDTDDSGSSDTTGSGDDTSGADSSGADSGYDASGSDFLVRRGQ